MNSWPIVTVVCPTTEDRKEFNERIYANFLAQDYPHKQFMFDKGDGTIGAKLNRMCEKAMGDVIVRFDSDDVYSSNWLTQSVYTLITEEADVVGLSKIYFFDPEQKAVWLYTYPNAEGIRPWMGGATLCFWKNLWRNNPFQDININEEGVFLFGSPAGTKFIAHNYTEGFVATIHPGNTSKKIVENARYRRLTEEEEQDFFKKRNIQ